MKYIYTGFVLFFLLSGLYAQSGLYFPDSLDEITVSGIALVDTSGARDIYSLDEDSDGIADYHLNFGPVWYNPDSSNALRPYDGQLIDIFGVVKDSKSDSLPVIIVYEINNLFWRDPLLPIWNPSFQHQHRHQYTYRHHHGFAGGWIVDSLDMFTIEGYVLIDSTCTNWHYYIDVDGDTIPEYFLNFGPPWYSPENGIAKPNPGEWITVEGALVNGKFIVFVINGETWFELGDDDSQFGSRWIYRNMNQNRYIKTPYDSLSGLMIRSGWDGESGQNHMPDSLYCQMLRLFPETVPYSKGEKVFAGFEIGLFTKNKTNLMLRHDSIGAKVKFAAKVHFRFHYDDAAFQYQHANENRIIVKGWDNDEAAWLPITDAQINTAENLITFESETMYSLIILTSESVTAVVDDQVIMPNKSNLYQNYPNPFNPTTLIPIRLAQNAKVKINIYNVVGQLIATLDKQILNAGTHMFKFNAASLTSGTYFYELNIDGISHSIRKMTLVK